MSESVECSTPEAPCLCYRNELTHESFVAAGETKYRVYDPKNDIAYELGQNEFLLVRLFDGARNVEDIQHQVRVTLRGNLSERRILAFGEKMLRLGLLARDGEQGGLHRDPATGITYGPLKRFLLVNLIKMDPQPLLDWLYPRFTWLCSPLIIGLMLMCTTSCFVFLLSHWTLFYRDMLHTYTSGWSWLAWHYPVVLSSIAIHELGHALSCRHYRVRVTDFGIGVYLLLATGWVRPEQRRWSDLSAEQRANTILMGPLASFYYAAAGIVVWAMTPSSVVFHDLGVVMIVASFLSLIPTLLPCFNGDTYLAITEFYNQPRLRQRALLYCRKRLAGKADVDDNANLYWGVTLLTAAGWLLAWCGIVALIIRVL